MKVPWKWRLHWLVMGMASIFGVRQTPEQIMAEVKQCTKEMQQKVK